MNMNKTTGVSLAVLAAALLPLGIPTGSRPGAGARRLGSLASAHTFGSLGAFNRATALLFRVAEAAREAADIHELLVSAGGRVRRGAPGAQPEGAFLLRSLHCGDPHLLLPTLQSALKAELDRLGFAAAAPPAVETLAQTEKERTSRGFRIFGHFPAQLASRAVGNAQGQVGDVVVRVQESSRAGEGPQAWLFLNAQRPDVASTALAVDVAGTEAAVAALQAFVREARAHELAEPMSRGEAPDGEGSA